MIPTIDIGLIASLTAIGGLLKTWASYVCTGLNFLLKRVLTVFIGSKFWCTTICLGVLIACIGLFAAVCNALMGYVVSGLVSLVLPDVSDYARAVSTFFPVDRCISFISFCLSALASYLFAINSVWILRHFSGLYAFLFRGIKL